MKKLETSIKNTNINEYWELVDLDLRAIHTMACEGAADPVIL
jgi:hypothetical protein